MTISNISVKFIDIDNKLIEKVNTVWPKDINKQIIETDNLNNNIDFLFISEKSFQKLTIKASITFIVTNQNSFKKEFVKYYENKHYEIINNDISEVVLANIIYSAKHKHLKFNDSNKTLYFDESIIHELSANLNVGIIITCNGNVQYANENIQKIVELDQNELKKIQAIDIALPEEKERIKNLLKIANETYNTKHELEYWIQTKTGKKKFIKNYYSPVINAENNKKRRYIITTDLTHFKEKEHLLKDQKEEYARLYEEYLSQNEELHQINEELHNNNNKLESAFEKYAQLFGSMPGAAIVLESDSNNSKYFIKDFNAAAEKLERLQAIEVKSRSFLDVFPDYKNNGVFEVINEVASNTDYRYIPVKYYEGEAITGWREYYIYKLSTTNEIVLVYQDLTEKKQAEERYKSISKTYQDIFMNSQIGLFRTRIEDGLVLEANDTFAQMLGYENRDRLLMDGVKVGDLYVNQQIRRKMLKLLLSEGRINKYEAMWQTFSGKNIWVRYSGFYNKKYNRLDGVCEDISIEKRLSIKAQEGQRRFKAIFDNSPYEIVLSDYNTGVIIDANERFFENSGYLREEVIGTNTDFSKNINPDKIKQLQLYAENKTPVMDFRVDFVNDIVGKRTVSLDIIFSQLGNKEYTITFIRDITEKVTLEKQIKESEAYFKSIFELANDAIFIIEQNEIVFCNDKALKLFNASRDEIIGKTPAHLSPEYQEDGKSSVDSVRSIIERLKIEKQINFNWVHRKMTGERFYGAVSFSLLDAEKPKSLAILRDITESVNYQKEIEDSKRRLSTLISNLPGMVYQCLPDEDYSMQYISDAAYQLTGYTPEEIINKKNITYYKIIHPDYRAYVSDELTKQLKNGRFVLTYKILCKSGKEKWVWEQGTPIRDAAGKISFFEGFITDITEQKIFEKQLIESEKKYKGLFENANDAIFIIQNGIISSCNNTGLKILGADSFSQVIGKTPADLSPEYQLNGKPSFDELYKHINKALSGKEARTEWLLKKNNGEIFYADITLSLIDIEDNKTVQAVARDISFKKQQELKLRESEERFREIFDNSNDILIISDLQRNIIDVNQKAVDYMKVPKAQIIGLKTFSLVPDTKEKLLNKNFDRLLRRGESVEYLDVYQDGKILFPAEIKSQVIKLNSIKYVLSIIRDISYQKQSEKKVINAIMETEEKERKRFSQDIHDGLGPLLSSLKLYASALNNEKNLEKRKEIYDRLIEVINAAIETGREVSNNISPYVLESFGLKSAIEAFIKKYTFNSEVDFDFNDDLNDVRFTHNIEFAVFRTIEEIIHNSFKHSKATKVLLDLKYTNKSLIIRFMDDGIGFDKDKVEKGMGLDNIRTRIKSIDGLLVLKTNPGEGVRYIIEIHNPKTVNN